MLKHTGGTAASSLNFKSDWNQTLKLLSAVDSTAHARPQNGEVGFEFALF